MKRVRWKYVYDTSYVKYVCAQIIIKNDKVSALR